MRGGPPDISSAPWWCGAKLINIEDRIIFKTTFVYRRWLGHCIWFWLVWFFQDGIILKEQVKSNIQVQRVGWLLPLFLPLMSQRGLCIGCSGLSQGWTTRGSNHLWGLTGCRGDILPGCLGQ